MALFIVLPVYLQGRFLEMDICNLFLLYVAQLPSTGLQDLAFPLVMFPHSLVNQGCCQIFGILSILPSKKWHRGVVSFCIFLGGEVEHLFICLSATFTYLSVSLLVGLFPLIFRSTIILTLCDISCRFLKTLFLTQNYHLFKVKNCKRKKKKSPYSLF